MTPQVREVLLQVPRSVSLEAKVGKERHRVGDLLETDSVSPEDVLKKPCTVTAPVLADLTEQERDVILMRFGLGDGHSYSLEVGGLWIYRGNGCKLNPKRSRSYGNQSVATRYVTIWSPLVKGSGIRE